MNIDFLLDKEFDIDEDLLGDIKISKDHSLIEESNTFIDSWLFCLIEILERSNNEKIVTQDLIEESYPIVLEQSKLKNILKYGKFEIFFDEINELKMAVNKSSKKLIKILEKESIDFSNNEILMKIYHFSKEK